MLLLALTGCAAQPPEYGHDEIDDLLAAVNPPARFAGHVPRFRVETMEHTALHASGPRTDSFYVIKDGDRIVATVHRGSGVINVLDFDPTTAPKQLDLPPHRTTLESSVGTKLRTDAFIPGAAGSDPGTYRFVKGDGMLVLVRRWKGRGTFNKWTYKSSGPVDVEADNVFVFRCDPLLGYVVEGTYDSATSAPPKTFQWFSAATGDMCDVWAAPDAVSRTVITPAYKPGYEGYGLNFAAIDICDNDAEVLTCRDRGFGGYLRENGWSPVTTIVGGKARLVVCNAHADLDFVVPWPADAPRDEAGRSHCRVQTRVCALPPEATRCVWDNMSMRFEGANRVMMRIGRVEDFEDQPLPLTCGVRGLTSTGGKPNVSTEYAHSGSKSVVLTGTFWPNLPQVPLVGGQKYRLQAWVKVVPWTREERAGAERKQRERIERARQRGRTMEDFQGFGEPSFHITGHLYVSSPHHRKWEVEQQTNVAKPTGETWQKVSLEFTAPDWGPFINIVFHANACSAYMDDFSLTPIEE